MIVGVGIDLIEIERFAESLRRRPRLAERCFTEAEQALSHALAIGHPDRERLASFSLWRGRARDCLGRREDALRDYTRARVHYADAPVRRAAERGMRRPFTYSRARRMHIDVGLADVVTP